MQIIFLPSLSRQVSGSSKLTMMLEGKLRLNEVLMMLTLKAFLNFLVISKKRFKTVMELFSDGIHKTTRKSHIEVGARKKLKRKIKKKTPHLQNKLFSFPQNLQKKKKKKFFLNNNLVKKKKKIN